MQVVVETGLGLKINVDERLEADIRRALSTPRNNDTASIKAMREAVRRAYIHGSGITMQRADGSIKIIDIWR